MYQTWQSFSKLSIYYGVVNSSSIVLKLMDLRLETLSMNNLKVSSSIYP